MPQKNRIDKNKLLSEFARLYPEPKSELDFKSPYQLLVAVVLSAQCTDKKVNETTPELFRRYPTFVELSRAKVAAVGKIIRPVNYYKTKAKNLIGLSKRVVDAFDGNVPSTHPDLTSLPGVGQKTANVVLLELGLEETFPVDTHVFRVSKRLGFARGDSPEEVEEELKITFDSKHWRSLHHWLIFHGRRVCKAPRPLCGECSLASMCPSVRACLKSPLLPIPAHRLWAKSGLSNTLQASKTRGSMRDPEVSKLPHNGITVAEILRALRPEGPVFIWESSQVRKPSPVDARYEQGRFSYLGFHPAKIIQVKDEQVTIFTPPRGTTSFALADYQNDPLQPLRVALRSVPGYSPASVSPDANLPPFLGGAVGFLAYDAARYFERIAGTRGHLQQPDAYFLIGGDLVIVDNMTRELWLVSSPENEKDSSSARHAALLEQIREIRPSAHAASSPAPASPPYTTRFTKEEFVSQVAKAKEYIRAGDVFQVVLANELTLPSAPDPIRLYEELRLLNPSPYHFLIRVGEQTIVGASPEVMLRTDRRLPRHVFTRPVAGTYPTSDTNALAPENFASDIKERAEHVMLVDLARNDLGRVSEIGSVKVTDLFSVETYSHVHHLVSQIGGNLRDGEDVFSALRACFPIGTLAGAPKIRAMEIISELEGPSRGIFGGAIVMADSQQMIDAAVAIRFAVIGEHSTTIQVGAGIVHGSIPEREYEECLWKAQAILQAIALADSYAHPFHGY